MLFLISDDMNSGQKTPDYQCVNRQSFKNRHVNVVHGEKHYPKRRQSNYPQNQGGLLI